MKKTSFLSIFIFLFIFASCSSNSADDNMNPLTNGVTYVGTIKAIIDNNCLNCHTNPPVNGAPMPLTTFQNVKEAVENRGLIGRVESGSMPLGGTPLTTTQVQAIEDWKTGGFIQ